MRYLIYSVSALVLLSCRSEIRQNQPSREKTDSARSNSSLPPPAAVSVNRSFVTASVLEVQVRDTLDFSIRAQIVEVMTSPGYASIAVKGNVYTLSPNFYLDDNHAVADNAKNHDLLALRNASPRDTVKIEIFLAQNKGWFIQSVVK